MLTINLKRALLPVLLFGFTTSLWAQAGKGVYEFLNLPISSRIAAMGGSNISLQENDLSFAFLNPSLLSEETHNMLSLNYASYYSDIMFGSAMYGRNYRNHYFAAGIHYVDYGKFDYATETGELVGGRFTAKDFAMNLVYAYNINPHFTVGATLKPIYSAYERYASFGLAMDIGAHFQSASKETQVGIVFRNMGAQLKGYYDEEDGRQHREPLPFDIQLGFSQKFRHAPIRVSVTLHNLQRWDLSYRLTNQPSTSNITTGGSTREGIPWYDMMFRHAIFAVDFVPTNNFYVALSYNHRRMSEMAISSFRSLAGFSAGAGVRIYKFHVGFGLSQLQLGQFAYQFSISTSLDKFTNL